MRWLKIGKYKVIRITTSYICDYLKGDTHNILLWATYDSNHTTH